MAKHKTAGKSDREGISLVEIFKRCPDDATAEAWFVERRWPNGIYCPNCGSTNLQTGAKHKTMPCRCREKECAKRFSAKTGTVMEGSKLGMRTWMIATYLLSTSLKSASSMNLYRDLNITHRSASFLAHRLRAALAESDLPFAGPMEADETYFGERRQNMPKSKRKALTGRGAAGKTAVAGVRDRTTGRVAAQVVENTDAVTLPSFVIHHTAEGAQVYTDDHGAYKGINRPHEAVGHSVGEYVRQQAHTNGIESFWAMLKRSHKGTFHKNSPKHLNRYVTEFAGRHNRRESDTVDIMASFARGAIGKRLRYRNVIADNGLSSGARG